MSLGKEFKEFAMKGNVVDMAVGIIVGAGFGKIVSSLVNDVIMPPIGMLMGSVDFKDLKYVLKDAVMSADKQAVTAPAVEIRYGMFINTTLDFLIVAFTIFLIIKQMNRFTRSQEAEAKG